MNCTFADALGKYVVVYLDDILVFSRSVEEHLVHLRAVFERLRAEKFFAKQQKCSFGRSTIKYLGHIVS